MVVHIIEKETGLQAELFQSCVGGFDNEFDLTIVSDTDRPYYILGDICDFEKFTGLGRIASSRHDKNECDVWVPCIRCQLFNDDTSRELRISGAWMHGHKGNSTTLTNMTRRSLLTFLEKGLVYE